MAGIGFELKKLFNDRSASGYVKAYSYSAIVTAGPFALMTGMVLAIQLMFRLYEVDYTELQLYTASVIYPFVFSNIVASGFVLVITRYLADQLYTGNHRDIIASLYGILSLVLAVGAILAGAFLWDKPLDLLTKLCTYTFYLELLIIWIQGTYLTAVKDYRGLLYTYAGGVGLSILLTFLVIKTQIMAPATGALLAMNIGDACIIMMFFFYIRRYFGGRASGRNFLFLPYFEQHKRLFGIGLFYILSVYLPNFIIWQGTFAVDVVSTYTYAPMYDVATFYAFLSIVPVMMMFVVSMELHFYEKYAAYFSYITDKGNFKEIEDAREDLLHAVWFELRNIMEFQLVFTLIFLALGNYFLPLAGLSYASLDLYNLIVLGAFFTGIVQVIYTLLLYFEDQFGVLLIVGVFFAANFVFGLLGFFWGEQTYGFTFFLAAALAFLVSLWRLDYFCRRINYYVFCSRPVFFRPPSGPLARITAWLYEDGDHEGS